jgi:hypothetical protein
MSQSNDTLYEMDEFTLLLIPVKTANKQFHCELRLIKSKETVYIRQPLGKGNDQETAKSSALVTIGTNHIQTFLSALQGAEEQIKEDIEQEYPKSVIDEAKRIHDHLK